MKKCSMRKLGVLFFTALFLLTSACGKTAQTNTYVRGFVNLSEESIYSETIVNTIEELSSEKYGGRLPGTEGNKMAEDYILEYFKSIGLEKPETLDSYKQTYSQKVLTTVGAPMLQIVDKSGKIVKDFVYPDNFINTGSTPGINLKGEVSAEGVVIASKDEIKNSRDKLKDKILIINKDVRTQLGNNRELMTMINGYGVKGLVLEIDITSPRNLYKHLPISPYALDSALYYKNGPLLAYAEINTFKEISEAAKQGNLIHIKTDYESRDVEVSNIIGVIPGSDEKLKNQYIIISGHMDHVGDNKNGTYNSGALDNASGVATLMEVAKAVKESKTPPKKTIVFIAFNGEEEGLLGAYHFAANPVFPMGRDNTVVINIDMVGSKSILPLTLGNVSELETKLREDLFKYAQDLNIECTKAVEGASDHTPFAERDIQALTLIHLDIENPAYHTPKDKVEDTIDRDRIGQIAKLVLYYIDKSAYNQ